MMKAMATVARYLGLALTVVYGGVAGGVVVRDQVQRGDWQEMLLLACWMVPMAALVALALLRPDRGGPVLGWTNAVVVETVLLFGSVGLVPGDLLSRVSAVLVFATAVPLGFLGLRRPLLAGVSLLALGVAFWLAVLFGSFIAGAARLHDLALTGWVRAVYLPVLLLGAVFLLAAAFHRPPQMVPLPAPLRPAGHPPGHRPGRPPGRRPGRPGGPGGRGSGRVGDGVRRRPAGLEPRDRHPER